MKSFTYLLLSCLILASSAFAKKAVDGSEFVGKDYTLKFPADWQVDTGPDYDVAGIYVDQEKMQFQTVNVVLENMAAGVSEDEYLKASLINLRQLPEVQSISEATDVKVGKLDAKHFAYTMDLGFMTLKSDAYVIIDGPAAYIISCGSNAEGYQAFIPVRDKILASFQIK